MKTTTTISIKKQIHNIGKEDAQKEDFSFSTYVSQLILRAREKNDNQLQQPQEKNNA